MSRLVCLTFSLLLTACGGGTVNLVTEEPIATPEVPPGEPMVIEGTAQYEARTSTPVGVSRTLSLRPARVVQVRVINAAGETIGSGETNDQGAFSIPATTAASELIFAAATTADNHRLSVTRDPLGRQPHESRHLVTVEEEPGRTLTMPPITISDEGVEGSGGAFHILDTLLLGSRKVREWTNRELPPFFVYWVRGQTTNWSFYRGEQPADSGQYSVELLGGEAARLRETDTDEHDESIVLHEFGHFVMDRLSSDSSPGGMHPAGFLLDPGLVWEEARASWFATSVLGVPIYMDTVGTEPSGHTRLREDFERRSGGPRGIGGEHPIAELLWDLSDGGDGIPDQDQDGVALGPAPVLMAMIRIAEQPDAFFGADRFVQYLVAEGLVEEAAMRNLLTQGGHPVSMLDAPAWPPRLAVPGRTSGKIDGMTNPAPSGGGARPENGIDARRTYLIEMPRAGWLTATLKILGSGGAADHTDLDLELRDVRADEIAAARSQQPTEVVSELLEPGFYVLVVRDGGQGTRVGFDLEVSIR